MEPHLDVARATWTEVAALPARVLLVPVGSCEQHGPHLPFETDTLVAVEVAGRVAAARSDAVRSPAVAFGASGEHQSFPGTLSIGTEALTTLLVELGRSAGATTEGDTAFRAIVFVNGHGGNLWAVHRAVEVLVGEGRSAHAWAPAVPGGDAHAGRTETSMLLAIAPDLVGPDRPTGATEPVADLVDTMRAGGVGAVSSNGVLGAATGASASEGRAILDDLTDDLDRVVAAVSSA